jgi:tRNA (guanine-N7-)-methyltransferase
MVQDPTRQWRLFGRSAGRPLSSERRDLVNKWMAELALPEGRLTRQSLGWPGPLHLEIGFGGGEHLMGRAANAQDTLFIGVEPFLDGIGKFAGACEQEPPGNVRALRGDGRDVLARSDDGLFEAVYLMFPDPWPKQRHGGRRFIQPQSVKEIHRVLTPSGRFILATDMRHYLNWTDKVMRLHGGFEPLNDPKEFGNTPPPGHIRTRYEIKNIGDCAPTFLQFIAR